MTAVLKTNDAAFLSAVPDALAVMKFTLGHTYAGALFLGARGNNAKIVGVYEPRGKSTPLPDLLRQLPVEGDCLPNNWLGPSASEKTRREFFERLEFFTTRLFEKLPLSRDTVGDSLDVELVVFDEPGLCLRWSHAYYSLQVLTNKAA